MPKHFDFVLLGGGPAGVSAAETLRAEGATGSILLVSGEPSGPYGHTFLPKQFLLGALPKAKLLFHGAAYYRERAIDVMPGVLAVAVDAPSRLVRTDCAGDFHFNKLLIATGTKPVRLTVPGSTLAGVHYLQTIGDAEALRQAAKNATRSSLSAAAFSASKSPRRSPAWAYMSL